MLCFKCGFLLNLFKKFFDLHPLEIVFRITCAPDFGVYTRVLVARDYTQLHRELSVLPTRYMWSMLWRNLIYVTFYKNEFFAFFKLFLKTDFPRKNYFNFRYFSGNKELNMLYLTSQNESLVFEPQFS